MGQTPHEGAGRRRAQRAVDAEVGQQGGQAQLLQRPQSDLLDADAAGADQTQRVDVDGLHVGPFGCRSARLYAAGDQLRGCALRFAFDRVRALGDQGRLSGQDLLDAGAQLRPLGLWDVEVASEIEQGALPDGFSDALGVDQAMDEVGPAVFGTPCLGAANEHAPTIVGARVQVNSFYKIMALHSMSRNPDPLESASYGDATSK